MNNQKNKLSSGKKKIIILCGVIILPIIIFSSAKPILDQLDHNRFKTLDKQIGSIFDNIKAVANNDDNWNYKKVCSAEYTGWMQTGSYFCHATISMDKSVTSANEVADLHAKYFSVIDKTKSLKQNTTLAITPSDFGKEFVFSSAEKHYKETETGIECWYLAELNQSHETTDNVQYGAPIDNGVGNFRISLDCSDKARNYWYEPDEQLLKTIFDYKPL